MIYKVVRHNRDGTTVVLGFAPSRAETGILMDADWEWGVDEKQAEYEIVEEEDGQERSPDMEGGTE